MRSFRGSTLSRREASTLIGDKRRDRMTVCPVERSLPSSELVGRGTALLRPSLFMVSPRKFLTSTICSKGGEIEVGLNDGTNKGRRGKP